MSLKNRSVSELFRSFLSELKMIIWDIIFTYKHFFHWNISKIISLLCSLWIWFLLAIPSIILMIIVAFIDPINWIQVLGQESFLWQLQDVGNIFWSLWVFFFWGLSFVLFFIWSWYYLMYLIRLSLWYVSGKKIKKKKLITLNKKQLFCFLRLTALNFICIFSPVFLWIVFWSLWAFFLGNVFEQSIITTFLLWCVYIFIVYITYKVQFSFPIFAEQKNTKNTSYSAIKYIKKSIQISKPKYFIKFIIIVFLYFVLLLPFRSIDSNLESQILEISNTYKFRNDIFIDLSQADRQYLEFIALDYEDYTDNELLDKINVNYKLRIVHFLVAYIFFGGLILLIVCSFYRRILLKK